VVGTILIIGSQIRVLVRPPSFSKTYGHSELTRFSPWHRFGTGHSQAIFQELARNFLVNGRTRRLTSCEVMKPTFWMR